MESGVKIYIPIRKPVEEEKIDDRATASYPIPRPTTKEKP